MSLIFLEFAPRYGPLTNETAFSEATRVVMGVAGGVECLRHKSIAIRIALREPRAPRGYRYFTEMVCS